MATSLAEQLQRLKAPQTGILLQDKKRASLLFDPKEAANLDRETVFNIGKNGLENLIKLSNLFKEFESTLFARSSIDLERSVLDSKVNKRLDAGIEKFLILLSPHFLLNTAHKALEWLIYRFHIHQYNKDQFMMLILPYHETKMFVRALQVVELENNSDKWHWLQPLQKPGIPLSSSTLVNRVSVDNGFAKLLCQHVINATSIYGEQADSLNTLYTFYTLAIIGGIERSPNITEVQIGHILPALIKGMVSPIPDFVAGNYMILAKLCCKAKLNNETTEVLLTRALKNPILKNELLLLIFFLYEAPDSRLKSVSEKMVSRFSKFSWLCEEITKIKSSGKKITKFLIPFLESAIRRVLKNISEEEEIKQMVQDIFEKVRFDDYEVDSILMETLKPSLANGKLGNESKSFLSTLYGLLEVRYPLRFDEYLKNLMKNSETCPESKKSLQFLMSWHSGAKNAKNSLDVFDQLNHYTPEYRISALKNLSKGKIEIAEGFEGMVKKSILDRFNDDNVEVVKALLNCPVKTLKSLFPSDNLIERLMILLSQCHTEKKHVLAQPAIKLLLDLCEDGDDTSVFIAILPYLFPNTDEEIKIAMQILRSEFAKKNQYLLNVRKHINDSADPTGIGGAAFHGLFLPELLPPTENIMTTMKLSSNNDATSLFFNLVLLGSVCRRKIGEISAKTFREITEMASEMMRKFPKVKALPKCNQLTNEQIQPALEYTSQGILPLQAGTYVLEMVYRRLDFKSNQTLDFENNSDFTQLVICIFETILEGQQSNSKQTKEHYFWLLKIFVQRHFQTSQMMIKFLSQCFIEPIKVQTSFHCLEMTLVLLDRSPSFHWIFEDKTFVTNLLIALSRENNDCRGAAVKILQRLVQSFNLELNGCATLFAELAKYSSEISMDAEQLPVILYSLLSPDPDVISSLKKDVKKQFKEMREFLFSVALDSEMPIHVKSQLLEVLAHVNGNEVLKNLTPQGLELMKTMKNEPEKPFVKIALKNILNRFNSTTVKALEVENVWELFEAAIENHELRIPMENAATQVPSVILMKQIDEVFFENAATVSGELQKKILGKLVDIVTNCEIGNIVAAANRAVRRIKINAQLVINELEAMKNAQVPDEAGKLLSSVRAKRRSRILEMTKKPEVINTREWKRGITILEFIQRAENIEKEYLLVPVLFDLLRMCLRFEEQSPLEYTNQLLLSTIYNLATKKLPIPDAHLQVDLISQCIRTSQNPQTHHHALLVLVELFKVADVETALHNIMPIFTFMGSSVLRQDDAYSIQIISKTIETVVPIVNAANDERHACEILRVFVISLPDIPEHRRLPLFVKLLQLLENHIHLFFLLTFETHVLVPSKDSDNGKMSSQRLEFALTISQEFSPKTLVDICVKLVNFIKSLPVEIDENSAKNISFSQKHIFDVAKNTPKQLRHYKYTIVQFLSALLSSSNFINRVASLSDEETEEIKPSYDELIVELVLLIQSASKSADLHQGKPKGKYWKVLLHNLYDILDAVNGLLPNQVFISSVKNLINHNHLTVRRKALELMNSRLQQKKFKEDDHDDLLTLINPLLEIISKQGKILSQDVEIIQQTSLITLKHLAKLLALENPGIFKPVLELTTEYLKTKDGPLLGSVVLCVAELCGTMKIHAIQLLNKFLPAIIHLMKIHCHQESPDVLVISIVSALQRIVESVGNFLSLYLDQLLAELCRLSSLYTMDLENQKTTIILSRLKATSQKLASLIPMRVFLPAVGKTYTNLLETKSYKCIPALMSILAESFTNISSSDLQVAIPDLSTFFLRVLQFREDLKEEEPSGNSMEIDGIDILKDIENVEEAAGKSLVALVFKLSEATFRPLYYKLYDWAARNPEQKLRNITFYRLSSNIAECLKSLFVLFAGHFMTHAAQLLAHNNLEIRDGSDTNTLELESNRIELIEAILSTLHKVFSYDANNFVNQERFEILCSPIVDQIENTVGTIEEFEKRAEELIVPCIASFASATQDDSLHKQLVYQVLLKTRHDKSYVRSAALSALVEIARKLGEDFMPLLPETVPFLAELLEDEDEATEKLAQNAVRTLEEVLGEPLQKYF